MLGTFLIGVYALFWVFCTMILPCLGLLIAFLFIFAGDRDVKRWLNNLKDS